MDLVAPIDEAAQFAALKIAAVSQADMDKPTPSALFAVRAGLNHMVGNLDMMAEAGCGAKTGLPHRRPVRPRPGQRLRRGHAHRLRGAHAVVV